VSLIYFLITILDINKKWSDLLTCDTKSSFLSAASEVSPRDYILNYEKLEYYANFKFATDYQREAPELTPFAIPQELTDWYNTEFLGTHRRRKSLILYGASRLGKTEWARSLGRHMYFNNIANFKDKWDDEASYIIFDDFNIDFIPNRKGFFGGQEEFEISGKYMRVRSVKWGKVCIYLCNEKPDFKDDLFWFRANVVMYHLENKLF